MSKFEEHADPNNSICPYCSHSYQVESEDYNEDTREIECDDCGKKYLEHQVFAVETTTEPDCDLNKENHDYVRVGERNLMKCSICGKYKLHHKPETP